MKRFDLNSRLSHLTQEMFVCIRPAQACNPVIRASYSWRIAAEQIKVILGTEIYNQWFKNITPVVISENALLLQTHNKQACHWINQHYQDLVDLLLSFQDPSLTSFFLSKDDFFSKPYVENEMDFLVDT
jgi:hypothetical protein